MNSGKEFKKLIKDIQLREQLRNFQALRAGITGFPFNSAVPIAPSKPKPLQK